MKKEAEKYSPNICFLLEISDLCQPKSLDGETCLRSTYGNNVEAFRYYLALKSGPFHCIRIIGKMLLRIVRCIYPNPVSAGCGLYRHQAWDHFFIIDTRAVQSLKAVIEK